MLTKNGTTINRDTARHKFGGDPMAEYLHDLLMESFEDESVGDANGWDYFLARFGRRILVIEPSGFVSVATYRTADGVAVAERVMRMELDRWNADCPDSL